MRRHLAATLSLALLVLAACTSEDGGGSPVSPTATFDLGSPAATESMDASPSGSAGASPSGSAEETADDSPGFGSPDASPSASATDDDDGFGASPSASATDDDDGFGGSATCEDSFGDVPDLTRVDSLRQLQDALEALDATIEACDSVDEWVQEAETRLDLANLDIDARGFLESRCEDSETLSGSQICEEL